MKAHVLATKIGSILTDNKFDRFVGGKTRGKLDFSSLSKISYSAKVFKKREARKNKDYKVIVLADASGSMSGSPVENVIKSMELLNEALAQTDVEYALWSFAGDILSLKDFSEKPKKTGETGALYKMHHEDRRLAICLDCCLAYGTFEDESNCPTCGKDVGSGYRSAGFNADGLAVHLALEAMKELSGEHILVVLSDGEADAIPYRDHLAYMTKGGVEYQKMSIDKVVKKAIADGVVVCSIGIQNNSVLRHYPKENTIVINDSKQIGESLIKLITKHIKRG